MELCREKATLKYLRVYLLEKECRYNNSTMHTGKYTQKNTGCVIQQTIRQYNVWFSQLLDSVTYGTHLRGIPDAFQVYTLLQGYLIGNSTTRVCHIVLLGGIMKY